MEATTLSNKELLIITGGWSRKDTKCVIGTGGAALAGAATGNPYAFIGGAIAGFASSCL